MSTFQNKNERILGLDYGLVNTGVAICEGGVVSPLKILKSQNFVYLQTEISSLIVKHKINRLVIGLPLSVSGAENSQSLKVRQFTNNLKKYVKVPIDFVNEYGSTQDFLSNGVVSKLSRKKVKNNDHYSAAIILEYYLESLN